MSNQTTERESCMVPPPGWSCTRTPGHEGPCAAVESSLEERLLLAQVASCSCVDAFSKMPDIKHHAPLCHFRVLEEARMALYSPHEPGSLQPGHDSYKRMFEAAVLSLAELSVALEIPPEVAECADGNAEMLDAIAALKARSPEPRDESAWLIEQQSGQFLHYFAPSMSKLEGVDVWEWTKDHLEAVRFSRRIDAEKALLYLRIKTRMHDDSNVVEHMWHARPETKGEKS